MVVRSDVRSRDYKISRMGILSHFLRNGATLASVSRARGAPLSIFACSLTTMAHCINATGELGHNETYIHIAFSYD